MNVEHAKYGDTTFFLNTKKLYIILIKVIFCTKTSRYLRKLTYLQMSSDNTLNRSSCIKSISQNEIINHKEETSKMKIAGQTIQRDWIPRRVINNKCIPVPLRSEKMHIRLNPILQLLENDNDIPDLTQNFE